jgi:hypothetical protein
MGDAKSSLNSSNILNKPAKMDKRKLLNSNQMFGSTPKTLTLPNQTGFSLLRNMPVNSRKVGVKFTQTAKFFQ